MDFSRVEIYMLTSDLLDKIKEQTGIKKENQLAEKIGITPKRLNNYRSGLCKPDEEACFLIADIINEEPAAVIAIIRMDTVKEGEKLEFWKSKAKKYAASAGIIAALLSAPTVQAQEGGFNNTRHYAHITVT